jgi:hypothetical protein
LSDSTFTLVDDLVHTDSIICSLFRDPNGSFFLAHHMHMDTWYLVKADKKKLLEALEGKISLHNLLTDADAPNRTTAECIHVKGGAFTFKTIGQASMEEVSRHLPKSNYVFSKEEFKSLAEWIGSG